MEPFPFPNNTSLPLSERPGSPSPRKTQHGDFISLVSSISRAYQRDRYVDMQVLDKVEWQDFPPGGSSIQISEAKIALTTASSLQFKFVQLKSEKIVIKKVKTWFMNEKDVRAFNRELRILDHLHDSNNIVKLHGIGWFIDKDPARVPVPAFLFEQAHYTLRYMIFRDANIPIRTILSESLVHYRDHPI